MAIISWPDGMTREQNVPCVICHHDTPLSQASAGLKDSKGQQAFACSQHSWSSSQLIVGWTDFAVTQSALRQQKEVATAFATPKQKVNGHGVESVH